MNDWLALTIVFAAGIGLGVFYFWGLWLTVQIALKSSSMSTLWVLGSYVFRIVLVMLAFYYLGYGSCQKMIACVAGFFVARVLVTNFTKIKAKSMQETGKEITHET